MKFGKIFLFAVLFFCAVPYARSAILPGHDSVEEVQQKISQLSKTGRSRKKAVLYSELGTLLYKEGRMREAAEAYEVALQYKTSRSLRRFIYVYLGKSYESHGRLDKGIAAYEEALALDPKDWRRHRDLGR